MVGSGGTLGARVALAPQSGPGTRAWLTAAACLVLLLCQCSSLQHGPAPQLLSHGPFDVYLYRPQGPPQHLALLLSGDGGWSSGLGAIAERLSQGGTLVAGINVRRL